ncbi:MAG: hypothetical protein ACD_7C00253G0002 [uncultured bacterium]|nr:MAG: hypothetical protein ACD_7C00253G0002 [uncultured bacterium]
MIRTIFSFIGALVGYVWSFLRIIRWPIAIVSVIGIIIFFSVTGYAFKVVYDGIIIFLLIFAVISLFVQPLRWVLLLILTAGGIFFAYNTIFLDKVMPYIEDGLSKNLPAYQEWKATEKQLANVKLAERTISAKKEMISSKVTKGTFGILVENSAAYDENGSIILSIQLKKGQRIMSLGLGSRSQSEDPNGIGTEGMAYVLIANEYGDFVKSRSALVPIRKIEWESNKKEEVKKSSNTPEWEKIADCPIHFNGRVFSDTVGPNGERPNTGEVYSGCFVEVGYEYKITFSGDYSQFFKHLPWYKKLSWSGWNPQIQDAIKPFPNYNYGALMLRIGAQNGLHPEKGKNFITFTPTDPAKILGELNITQREDSYIDQSSVGNKIQDSTLSIKIERRPL